MKKIFLSTLVFVSLFGGQYVFAEEQDVQTSNSDKPSITIEFNNFEKLSDDFKGDKFESEKIEIDKKDMGFAGGFLVIGLVLLFGLVALSIACLVFWIMMIVHVISKPVKSKAVWVLVLILGGFIGALVYYFAVKRKFNESSLKKEEEIKAEKVEN